MKLTDPWKRSRFASLRIAVFQIARVPLSVFGMRRSAFARRRRQRFERDILQLDRAPQKARLIVVVLSDPYRIRMRRLHFPDGGVQIFIPAPDLELVVTLLEKQMRLLLRSRHIHHLLA